LKQILKHLKAISTFIDLEDDEQIVGQVTKLKTLSIDTEVQEIVNMIENQRYENVFNAINDYVYRFSKLEVWEDPKVKGLKVELSILEKELNELSENKNEYLTQINAFNAQYYAKLGAIVEEILRLKKDMAQRAYDKGEINKEEFQAFKEEHESFYKEAVSQSKEQPNILSDEEEKKLKKAYRKASRLTHPDIVADAFKEEATKIFVALNEAYKRKDLAKVEEILKGLESGVAFAYASDEINDVEVLREKSEILRKKIEVLKEELEVLKESETYVVISSTSDLESYFLELRDGLVYERDEMREALKKN
jgi:hypothetical protein